MRRPLLVWLLAATAQAQDDGKDEWYQDLSGGTECWRTSSGDSYGCTDAGVTSDDKETDAGVTSDDKETDAGVTSDDKETDWGDKDSDGSDWFSDKDGDDDTSSKTPAPPAPPPRPELPPGESRPKVLCLHGGGQSAASFQWQASDLVAAAPGFDFVFVDAPQNGRWLEDPPSKSDPTTDPDWDRASYELLNSVVQAQGPFFGIMGYSQGSAYATAYLAQVPPGTFSVALLFCGYLPSTHLGVLQKIYDAALLPTPAFLFIGEQDTTIEPAYTREQATVFAAPQIASSANVGHNLPPPNDPNFDAAVAFLTQPREEFTPAATPAPGEPTPDVTTTTMTTMTAAAATTAAASCDAALRECPDGMTCYCARQRRRRSRRFLLFASMPSRECACY